MFTIINPKGFVGCDKDNLPARVLSTEGIALAIGSVIEVRQYGKFPPVQAGGNDWYGAICVLNNKEQLNLGISTFRGTVYEMQENGEVARSTKNNGINSLPDVGTFWKVVARAEYDGVRFGTDKAVTRSYAIFVEVDKDGKEIGKKA